MKDAKKTSKKQTPLTPARSRPGRGGIQEVFDLLILNHCL